MVKMCSLSDLPEFRESIEPILPLKRESVISNEDALFAEVLESLGILHWLYG